MLGRLHRKRANQCCFLLAPGLAVPSSFRPSASRSAHSSALRWPRANLTSQACHPCVNSYQICRHVEPIRQSRRVDLARRAGQKRRRVRLPDNHTRMRQGRWFAGWVPSTLTAGITFVNGPSPIEGRRSSVGAGNDRLRQPILEVPGVGFAGGIGENIAVGVIGNCEECNRS